MSHTSLIKTLASGAAQVTPVTPRPPQTARRLWRSRWRWSCRASLGEVPPGKGENIGISWGKIRTFHGELLHLCFLRGLTYHENHPSWNVLIMKSSWGTIRTFHDGWSYFFGKVENIWEIGKLQWTWEFCLFFFGWTWWAKLPMKFQAILG